MPREFHHLKMFEFGGAEVQMMVISNLLAG
jgi:hypothetical protein